MRIDDKQRAVESRMVDVMGVVWTLMLVGEPGDWTIHAETLFGEGPEPFNTSDEAQARNIFENFEKYLVSCPRSSLHNSPALDGPGCVGPPRNTPGMPSSARLARTADGSPTHATNFSDRTLAADLPLPSSDDGTSPR